MAVSVAIDSGDDGQSAADALEQEWAQWDHKVPLVTLSSPHRTLGPPIVEYLRKLEREEAGRRLVVLIAELEPIHPWEWILHNQRGLVLDRAIRRDTTNVVICRIRFRATTWTVKPVS